MKIVIKYNGLDGKKHQKTLNPSKKQLGLTAGVVLAMAAGAIYTAVK